MVKLSAAQAVQLKHRMNATRLRGLVVAFVMAACIAAMLFAALRPSPRLFVGVGLLGYAAEMYLHMQEAQMMKRLGQLRAGVTMRTVLRTSLLLVLMGRIGLTADAVYLQAAVLVPLLLVLQALYSAVAAGIRRNRSLPVVTRNLPLGDLRISDTPPTRLLSKPGQRLLHQELLVLLGIVGYMVTGRHYCLPAGLLAASVTALLTILQLLPSLRRALRFPKREAVLAHIDQWLAEYRPDVVLYFSGGKDSAYQVNMWLDTMADLAGRGHRPMLVMRERGLVRQLNPTALPVLCVPAATHLMNMDMSSVRVALYPANVGKNIHFLRIPGVVHVFIGHGDSDKLASVNPFSKVYDEVWVAGRAGRDRYALAGVGVRDEEIVEVGRPQLDELAARPTARTGLIPTVLYAPTWEGWTEDPGNTSLLLAGENIVKKLLGGGEPVRLLYKPHPFTGLRDPKAKKVHERIVRMIERANTKRSAQERWQDAAKEGAAERAAAQTEEKRLVAELDRLRAELTDDDTDDAQLSRDSGRDLDKAAADGAGDGEQGGLAALRAAYAEVYWRARGSWEHQVIEATGPHLYDCFEQADLLISDISSVVSDFICTLKPYALTDTARLGVGEFREQNTAARAAYLLKPNAKGIPKLVRMLTRPENDVLRPYRLELRDYLLGPQHPLSMDRFAEACRVAVARADAEAEARTPHQPEHEQLLDAFEDTMTLRAVEM
ncbi:hypothetical protein [Kitasatospora camelliae]|uniref:CDP-glycerol:poly(Glycerophosphate) glycerophosphotransferase n=1 Tax=Kitasatospora camelliae TaxID=3156397 RepID=A0AAU8JZF2_9ACTN